MQKDKGTSDKAKCFVVMILIALTIPNLLLVTRGSANGESGIFIDLFTQKAPFDGRGINQSSDMFGPQEEVTLYTLVLQNGVPFNGTLVTYEVQGPINASKDIRFYQTAATNSSGIAQTEFSLAVINQTDAFGTWTATASVQVEGKTYSDILTFSVDYIVKIVFIRTLNENLTETKNFGDGGYVGFEIALQNNAMVKKNTTLAITVFDELGVPVNSSQIHDLIIPPGHRIQYVYGNSLISKFAVPGNATIIAVALDNNLVAYGPEVSAEFSIQPFNPIFPDFVDLSVYVEASPTIVEAGKMVKITLLVTNQGTVTLEDFNATLEMNDSLLNSYFIRSLGPYQDLEFEFYWNTSGFSEGTYIFTAMVPVFQHEADLSDNAYSCQVGVMAKKPTIVHDIEVTYANCSKNEVYQGEIVSITVVIRNNGNLTESTNVSVYYDDVLIEKRLVSELLAATGQVTVFQWNTTNVPNGTYEIIAKADPVEGEMNVANNVYYDGFVQIRLRPSPTVPSAAILGLTVLVLMLVAVAATIAFLLLLFMLDYLRRRRKKKPLGHHFAVIARPHV
jgi:hypothetical protein